MAVPSIQTVALQIVQHFGFIDRVYFIRKPCRHVGRANRIRITIMLRHDVAAWSPDAIVYDVTIEFSVSHGRRSNQ
jgi:hypothetical protein